MSKEMKKKVTEETTAADAKTVHASTPRRYVEIPLPRFQLKPLSSYTPILVVLMIIASFLLGSLFTKVQYLEKNPSTNTQAVAAAPAVQGAQAEPTSMPPQDAVKIVEKQDAPLPLLGQESAKVHIVEFSDFQCPFCKSFFDQAYADIKKEYIDTGKVKLSFRHYPLPFHQNAQKAAEASECANEQGNFWGFHDELFNNQTAWESLSADAANDKFAEIATGLGLSGEALKTCLTDGKYAQKVTDDSTAGGQAGVSGTPTVYINGVQLVGAQPFSSFKTAIDAELAK